MAAAEASLVHKVLALHDALATASKVADRVELHPFADRQLPFLAALDLAVFKSLFDRPKDWLDIAAMHEAGALDVDAAAAVVHSVIGDDPRVSRLTALASGS